MIFLRYSLSSNRIQFHTYAARDVTVIQCGEVKKACSVEKEGIDEWGGEGVREPNIGPSLADVLLCTFESTNAKFSFIS